MASWRRGSAFELTSLTDSEALFENPAHDFPTRERHVKKSDDAVTASVEGERGGKPAGIEFPCERAP